MFHPGIRSYISGTLVFVKWPRLLLDLRRTDPESVITFPANTSIQHVWSSTVWLYLLLVVVANAGKRLIFKISLINFQLTFCIMLTMLK